MKNIILNKINVEYINKYTYLGFIASKHCTKVFKTSGYADRFWDSFKANVYNVSIWHEDTNTSPKP